MSIHEEEYLIKQIETEEKIELFLDNTRQTLMSLKGLTFESNESVSRLGDWSYGAINLVVVFGNQLKSMSPSNPDLISKAEALYSDLCSCKLENDVLV